MFYTWGNRWPIYLPEIPFGMFARFFDFRSTLIFFWVFGENISKKKPDFTCTFAKKIEDYLLFGLSSAEMRRKCL